MSERIYKVFPTENMNSIDERLSNSHVYQNRLEGVVIRIARSNAQFLIQWVWGGA